VLPATAFSQTPTTTAPADAAQPGDAADRLYQLAMKALQDGRFDAAQRQFEMFVAASPDHPMTKDARKHLAELYSGLGTVPVPPQTAQNPDGQSQRDGEPLPVETPRNLPAATVPVQVEDSFITEAGDRVFFGAGSADLGARARAVIAAQARWLKRRAELHIVIEGHADDGALSAEQSETLSAARAETVYNRLLEEGIAKGRISIASWGRDRPIATCAGSDCAAQNRRAVTVLTPKPQVGALGPEDRRYNSSVASPAAR
jgi:outer membrane protein OmpA-like peptidoglycan-associated protein